MTRYIVEKVVRNPPPFMLELQPMQIATLYHCVIAMRDTLNLPKLMSVDSKERMLAEHYEELEALLAKALDDIKLKLMEDK